MIQRSIRLMWRGAILAFLVYLLFIVQLGERSTFGHLMRVIRTDEAQELGHEMSRATQRLAQQIGDQVKAANAAPDLEAIAAEAEVPEGARDAIQEAAEDELGEMAQEIKDDLAREMAGEAFAERELFEVSGREPAP